MFFVYSFWWSCRVPPPGPQGNLSSVYAYSLVHKLTASEAQEETKKLHYVPQYIKVCTVAAPAHTAPAEYNAADYLQVDSQLRLKLRLKLARMKEQRSSSHAVQMCLQLKILITSVVDTQNDILKSSRRKLYQPQSLHINYIIFT